MHVPRTSSRGCVMLPVVGSVLLVKGRSGLWRITLFCHIRAWPVIAYICIVYKFCSDYV